MQKKIPLPFDIVVLSSRSSIFKDKGYVTETCRFVKNITKNLIILDDVGFIFFKQLQQGGDCRNAFLTIW